ncbi:uncharacterized protein [Henckelia pumila]|uniref:uncharacterized protein isoform X2 n=1 Tax=Henckelia pumila TaxID=405737 RepID=UPI003C6E4430
MEFSSCPLCQLTVPSSEIQRHANEHFADEDYAADFEIAQQIALAPASPPRFAEDTLQLVCSSLDHPQSSSSGCLTCCGRNLDEKCATLFHSQEKESFYKVEGGLMLLLKSCLELDRENSVSILSGHVDHIQSSESEDVGWGCGWRNIQMLSSHLLSQRQEASDVLFGGSGFIPDITSLQRWLELAWEKGFDAPGSDDFDKKVYGKCDWIGTTECATLLCSFGLRAGIVDFCDKDLWLDTSGRLTSGIRGTNKSVDKRKYSQVYGPMDIFLSEGKLDSSLSVNSMNGSSKHFDVSSHKVIEWVWNYFSGNKVNKPGNLRVILSEKAPLYFQHHGHSRTIVGIQATVQQTGMQRYNLLIFDPAEKTRALEKSLRANLGWQKLIKRGAHTLKKLQYQLCFVDYGIAHGEELERLKALHSIRHNL